MSEVKDPAIKLFGKTISLPPHEPVLDHHPHEQPCCSTSQDNKSALVGELTSSRLEIDAPNLSDEESIEPLTNSEACDTPKTLGADAETLSPKVTTKEEPSETNGSEEKTLKKPDKILPCPRCNSMDTKFCYYNNYNVNQPRHFCRKCQRYWTAGGTMRNVPVGSGRRKNKNSCASNYRHIMLSEALQAAQADANGMRPSPLKADGTVFAFGSERPICESLVSALDLAERAQTLAANGFQVAEQRIPVSYGATDVSREHSNGFCSTRLNVKGKQGNAGVRDKVSKNLQVFPPQVPYLGGTSWPSQWNSVQWTSPTAQNPFSPSGFPVTFYSASPYFGCSVPGPWNVTWLSPPPSSPNHSAMRINPTSPTLGKHSRDGSMLNSLNNDKEEPLEQKDADRSVLLPKTLRIDNPNEAAKSSVSSTLRIKGDNRDSVSGASLFKAFHTPVVEKNHVADTSLILQANPAAFSRSVNFHEST